MKAVVLAGGTGQRLLPYTGSLPKPMMPIGNRPLLEIIMRQLQAAGVEEIVLATGYLEEVIRTHFGDGWFGVPIRYSHEENPLGTAGPLSLARQYLTEPFLVINGDILTDLNFREMLEIHHAQNHDVTLGLANRKQYIGFGVVRLNGARQFDSWDEKPVMEYLVSAGICLMSPKVLDLLPDHTFLNLPDYVTSLKNSGFRIGAYVHEGYWLDIGRREDYERACRDAELLGSW